MVSDNFPYVNRRFLSVCMDGLKVMLKPFTVRANDVVSLGVALCLKGNRGFRNQENLCLWNPESHYILEARLESSTWNPQSTAWNPNFKNGTITWGERWLIDWPDPCRRNENFIFNQNYTAKTSQILNSMQEGDSFSAKPLEKVAWFHCQIKRFGNGLTGQFWQMESALSL